MSNEVMASVAPAIIAGLVFGMVSGSLGITTRYFLVRWGFPAAIALLAGIIIGAGSGIAFTSTLRTSFNIVAMVATCGVLSGVLPWIYTSRIFHTADES